MTCAPQFLPIANFLASTARSTWVSSSCCPVPYAGAQALLTRIIASAVDTANAAATTFSPSRSASSTTREPKAFTRPDPDGKHASGQTLTIWTGPSMRCAASFGYKEGYELMRDLLREFLPVCSWVFLGLLLLSAGLMLLSAGLTVIHLLVGVLAWVLL